MMSVEEGKVLNAIHNREFHSHAAPDKCVSDFLLSARVIVDVRSPMEFAEGCIPNSVNIPLMNDEERGIIGRIYKYYGKQMSVDAGYKMIGPDVSVFLDKFKDIFSLQPVGMICARGGMRSSSVTNLLNLCGIQAFIMKGGYKNFRRYILNTLENISFQKQVFILHGFTGSGKTQLLKKLPNSICLESIAGHRNSIFGGIGLKKVTQKNFESGLFFKLKELSPVKPVLFEGEGKKIGDNYVPTSLCKVMETANHVFLNTSFEVRVKNTLQNYGLHIKEFKNEFLLAIQQLTSYLGKTKADIISDAFMRSDFQTVTEILLKEYYDKKYSHSYKKYNFTAVINGDSPDLAVREITEIIH